jgi:Tfp pilus assembly protein PilF
MGKFQFEAAEAELVELLGVLEKEPQTSDDIRRLVTRSLGIARLNQSEEGSQERAIELLEPLVASDPNDVRTHYCLGLARLFLGDPERAREHFAIAATKEPNDPYARYYLGQCLEFSGQADAALEQYLASAAADPYLRSPILGVQRLAARRGDETQSSEYLKRFQALAENPQARLAEFKYTRMGQLAEVALPRWGKPEPTASTLRSGALFSPNTVTVAGDPAWGDLAQATLTAADIDGDGAIDLFATAALKDGRNAVLLSTGANSYRVASDHPLASVKGVRAALWGDIDNDGDVDVYFCRKGPNALFLGDGKREFTPAPVSAGVDGGEADTVDGVLADLDHDGDLDIFLCNASAPSELLSNNLDGTFRAIGASSGAIGDGRPVRAVLVNDVDSDRDADLFLVHDTLPNELLLNDRLWTYTTASDPGGLEAIPFAGALAADWDADGYASILGIDKDGAVHIATPVGGTWAIRSNLSAAVGRDGQRTVAVGDVDGDGTPNLLWVGTGGVAVAALDGQQPELTPLSMGAAAWTLVQRTQSGPSVAILGSAGLTIFDPGPRRGNFATVTFAGRTDPTQSMRSNVSGIGTTFAARVAGRWVGGDTYRSATGPGQSLQPVSIGLADSERIDFIAMEWSDGVYQSESDLAARATHVVTETQRQISSCPVIFAWDGSGHRFVTDCLGVGGLGYLVAPQEYAPPRPWERILFPADLVPQLRDGTFDIRLGEPMEEACYLDAARLVTVDLPPGWSLTVDERMGLGGPDATGEIRFYRERRTPAKVFDDGGRVVTSDVVAPDGIAAPISDIDPRFIGYLRRPRTLTIEFDSALTDLPGDPTLIAHGWVEYPYSQTNFAAWQAGVTAMAPDLEARDGSGTWHRVYVAWGYPAGMPREISLPLEGLPDGTTALRLTSNQEIYWDSFAVVGVEPCPEARRVEIPLVSASVAETGFADRIPQPNKRPDYRYERRLPLWDARYQPGFYTAFGACTELLSATDDAVAIFGPGEEIQLRFKPTELGLSAGERRFILEVDGWCKDLDLFTNQGETLGPIPTRSGSAPSLEAQRLMRTLNTRYRDGR